MLDEPLPISRLPEQLLHLALPVVVVEEHLVEEGVRDLHVHKKLVVLISVRLHTLMPLLKLIVLCPELDRGVADADLDQVLVYV